MRQSTLWLSQHHTLLVWRWLAFNGSTMFEQRARSWTTRRRLLTVLEVTQTPVAWKNCCCSWVAVWVRSFKAFVTSRWSWRWVEEHGRPLRGKSVTFPIWWWRFHSPLMTECDTLNGLATFRWILRFCSIPVSLQLSHFGRQKLLNEGLWTSRGLKQKSYEHCSDRVLRGWQVTGVVSIIGTL